MKKHLIYNFFGSCLLSLILLSYSCTDYLDKSPDAEVSETEAFVNFMNFQGFVEEIYSCMPDITGKTWATNWILGDEIVEKDGGIWLNTEFDKGNYWAWTTVRWISHLDHTEPNTNPGSPWDKGMWPLAWYGIRKANMGLENLDLLVDATKEEYNVLKGQMLFFRGFFHFQLMQYWGGMPYIDRVLPAEDLTLPRLNCHDTADLIAADLREAADLLPANWDNTQVGNLTFNKNQQRLTKIAALGYLGKTYLFAGSPLANRESTGVSDFNAEYCKKAAGAFAELLKIVDSGDTWIKLVDFSDYSNIFYSWGRNGALAGYPEAILQAPLYDGWFNGCPWGPASAFGENSIGAGFVSPNARYVMNYGMANGLPITDPASGYDPDDPWTGRDPRFYHDIVIDGDPILKGYESDPRHYAELFNGGRSKRNDGAGRTGYLLRKLTPVDANEVDNNWGGFLQISYMRLADVYLMYAESVLKGYGTAASSATGYDLTAEEAVNVIRRRCGAGEVDAKYTGDPQLFMEEIIRERAVELGFEHNQRFNDLRRWRLAEKREYREKTAIDFDRDPNTGKPINIQERVIQVRPWGEKAYWLPLKIDDVTLYPSFGQNPGW